MTNENESITENNQYIKAWMAESDRKYEKYKLERIRWYAPDLYKACNIAISHVDIEGQKRDYINALLSIKKILKEVLDKIEKEI